MNAIAARQQLGADLPERSAGTAPGFPNSRTWARGPLAERHHDPFAVASAQDGEGGPLSRVQPLADEAHDVASAPNRSTVDRQDHVAAARDLRALEAPLLGARVRPGMLARAVRLDARNERAGRDRDVEEAGKRRRQVVGRDPDVRVRDLSAVSSSRMDRRAVSIGTAKPTPSPPPVLLRICALIPITRPRPSSSGPPELPWLIAASVWIASVRSYSRRDRRDRASRGGRRRRRRASSRCRRGCRSLPRARRRRRSRRCRAEAASGGGCSDRP